MSSLRNGLPYRMLPPETFPLSINHALVMVAREQAGCAASLTAGVIDS